MSKRQFAIIGIGGVTNGGKTTLSARLKQQLPNVHILNMDCYYWPDDSPHHIMLPQFNYANWEVPSSVDFVRLLADTEKWVETVRKQPPGGRHILLIEGILIYNFRPLLQYFNKKYAFTLSLQECRTRRRQRRYVPPDPDGYFDAIVWPHYLENSMQIEQQNDIVYLDGSVDVDVTFQQVFTDIKLLFK
ncbi:hypothetical protein NP493_537g00008 [Ridgeia piscesae]|uniref:Nicotinamide riboside kinase 1 n=1 Tax=Ridgeia piscesae TaxID=27915 RepID=A0AAD9KWI5_RIDPI|nr:hypothetical protein NP493_537g00008 [Ridgeia piscesae]